MRRPSFSIMYGKSEWLFWSICCSPVWVVIKHILLIFYLFIYFLLWRGGSAMLSITEFWITCISIPPLQSTDNSKHLLHSPFTHHIQMMIVFFLYNISLLILNIGLGVHHFFQNGVVVSFKVSLETASLPPTCPKQSCSTKTHST